jgi:hypothetical protein
MQAPRERGAIAPTYFDLGTRWGEWSASRPGRALPLGKGPRYPLVGGWVGLRAGLDTG